MSSLTSDKFEKFIKKDENIEKLYSYLIDNKEKSSADLKEKKEQACQQETREIKKNAT